MAAAAQDWWKTTVNPATGDYFADYDTANAWAMNKGGKAASAGFAGATPATTADESNWNWYGTSSFQPREGGYNFQGAPETHGAQGTIYTRDMDVGGTHHSAGDYSFANTDATGHYLPGEGKYSGWADYGLGTDSAGVIPIAHNAQGAATNYLVFAPGGGATEVQDLGQAQQTAAAYRKWYAEVNGLDPTTGAKPGSTVSGSTGGGSNVLQTNGELLDPGYGEKAFEDLQGFYKSPTEQRKKWDQMRDQPSEQEQQWNKYEGVYANPGTEQSELWGNWESLFSNPEYLDDYYRREGQKAQTTLDRKASSGGWGDSGAAARATANIDRDFADRALLAKGQWAQQGMGLAGAADSSMNTKATTGMGLAGAADKGRLDNLAAAGNVDQGELAKATSYGVGANAAQNLKHGRLTGGLNAEQGIADDMAGLSKAFYSEMDAQQFNTAMQGIAVQYQMGNLTLQQAVNQAEEAMAGMRVASQTALNSAIISKLTNNSSNPNNLPLG